MPKSYRRGFARRLVNLLMKGSLRLGISGRHTYLLSVPGRKSGRTYSTPVILVENSERWLVGAYGEVSWVRNVRAAGRATLSRGRHHEEIEVSEVGPPESAPVLREYLRQVRVVRPFFDASPAASNHRHREPTRTFRLPHSGFRTHAGAGNSGDSGSGWASDAECHPRRAMRSDSSCPTRAWFARQPAIEVFVRC